MILNRKLILIAFVAFIAGGVWFNITRTQAADEPAQPSQAEPGVHAPAPPTAPADLTQREEYRNQLEAQNSAANPPTVIDSETDSAGSDVTAQAPPTDHAPVVDDELIRAESPSSNDEQIAENQTVSIGTPDEQQPMALQSESPAGADPRAPILASRRLSYQAVLTDNMGNALPGPTVNLAFRIYTAAAVLVEGPINVLGVAINDGVVDTAFPVSASTFDGSDRLLGVTVNAGPELVPRIPLTAVAYALRVDRVLSEELDDNIILGRGAAPLAAGSLNVQNGVMAQSSIELNGVGHRISTYGSDGLEQIRLYGPTWGELWLNDSTGNDTTVLLSASNNVGGMASFRDSAGAERVQILGQGTSTAGEVTISDADGTPSIQLMGAEISTDGGQILINNDLGANTIELDGDSANSGFISIRGSDGAANVFLDGESVGAGLIEVDQADSSLGVRIDGDAGTDAGGLVSVHDSVSAARVQLLGESTGTGGEVSVFDDDGTETVEILGAQSAAEGGNIYIRNAVGTNTIQLDGDSGDAAFVSIRNTAGLSRVTLDGDSAGAGLITLYQNDSSTGVTIDGDGGTNVGGLITVRDSVSATRVQFDGESVGTGGEISVFDDDGTETIEILGAESTTTGGQILLRDAAGNAEITLDGEFGSAGDPGRITTPVLQITGGSDLSEDFDVNGDASPGMVVCIDKENPGMLVVSSQAYDHKVAGIVSGAGGVRTGLLMGQRREPGQDHLMVDGKIAVALTGRVYCHVDARDAEVQPGDLLTTSDTPGHAMKVLDFGKAQGAIIGKAMTGLAKGQTGLVLVLVNMQ